jgi:hypothetical protein
MQLCSVEVWGYQRYVGFRLGQRDLSQAFWRVLDVSSLCASLKTFKSVAG